MFPKMTGSGIELIIVSSGCTFPRQAGPKKEEWGGSFGITSH